MKQIAISDITLREEGKNYSLSFKEKLAIVKILDKLNVDVIETAPITKGRTDILFLHSASPIISNSTLSCPVSLTKESVTETFEAIKSAKNKRLHIMAPVSTVQMEYICHKKPKAMLETLDEITKLALSLTDDVEISLLDSTRAEKEFLFQVIKNACASNVKTITLCDSSGEMLPIEFEEFLKEIYKNVPEIKNVNVSVECSDKLSMASACAVSCVRAGISQLKTISITNVCPSLEAVAHIFSEKADMLKVSTKINMPVLENSIEKIKKIAKGIEKKTSFDNGTTLSLDYGISLTQNDDISVVKQAVDNLGYELSDEDFSKVFEEFTEISKKKKVGARELDTIIASVAMQVPPTYKLKSYVINSGNIITPTAHVELEKNGEILNGICIGDGPIDAAFLAIEQITKHHFELDDFQIQSVTEGREAMGSSIVKLRHEGKPYSGKGISTDIVGASINAYINALNKICFEEENV